MENSKLLSSHPAPLFSEGLCPDREQADRSDTRQKVGGTGESDSFRPGHPYKYEYGTGQNLGTPRGGPERLCWSVCCRIRAGSELGSPPARTNRTWWRASTRCCDAWEALPAGGGCVQMATVIVPGTDRLQSSFVPVAKHYGVGVDPCPPRRPQRKGVVEKAIHYISQRWWRTATVNSLGQAQDSLDEFCVSVGDARRRGEATVGELADSEPLLELPPLAYPAEGALERKVAANGLVSVWGNRYSVPPGVIDTQVTVRWRLGDPTIDMVSESGRLVATHRKAPRGLGRVVRLPEHTAALENVVLAAFTTKRPCKPKPNRPPTEAARAIAAGIRGETLATEPVIDLGVYQRHVEAQTRRRRS